MCSIVVQGFYQDSYVHFIIFFVGIFTVLRSWILLPSLCVFYDSDAKHFNELCKTQTHECKDIFNDFLINNNKYTKLNIVDNHCLLLSAHTTMQN